MNFVQIYLLVVLGIAISILLPVLRQALPQPKGAAPVPLLSRLWAVAKPYLALAIFSLLGGLLVVAAAGDSLKDWKAALLAGYAWDSTLQKLKG